MNQVSMRTRGDVFKRKSRTAIRLHSVWMIASIVVRVLCF